jgi:hypothetical protein
VRTDRLWPSIYWSVVTVNWSAVTACELIGCDHQYWSVVTVNWWVVTACVLIGCDHQNWSAVIVNTDRLWPSILIGCELTVNTDRLSPRANWSAVTINILIGCDRQYWYGLSPRPNRTAVTAYTDRLWGDRQYWSAVTACELIGCDHQYWSAVIVNTDRLWPSTDGMSPRANWSAVTINTLIGCDRQLIGCHRVRTDRHAHRLRVCLLRLIGWEREWILIGGVSLTHRLWVCHLRLIGWEREWILIGCVARCSTAASAFLLADRLCAWVQIYHEVILTWHTRGLIGAPAHEPRLDVVRLCQLMVNWWSGTSAVGRYAADRHRPNAMPADQHFPLTGWGTWRKSVHTQSVCAHNLCAPCSNFL